MKVKQFINKLLYERSTIKRIYVSVGIGRRIILDGEVIADHLHADRFLYIEELNRTVRSFSIIGDDLTIYCD